MHEGWRSGQALANELDGPGRAELALDKAEPRGLLQRIALLEMETQRHKRVRPKICLAIWFTLKV